VRQDRERAGDHADGERQEMLEALGLKSRRWMRWRMPRTTCWVAELLHAGRRKVRAWTVPIGATAPQAAG